MGAPASSTPIYGIDFTSAPREAKPITVAGGYFAAGILELEHFEELPTLDAYERWLLHAGPWVGGFDFPFGLPRAALQDLGWPLSWLALTQHCAKLGRKNMRTALDAHRAGRPVGSKFCFRRGDEAAGSHSPLKLVNPPVALMFLEGATRLPSAGVSVPGMFEGDPQRIALEAYPGIAVRRLLDSRSRVSYKNDAAHKQTAAQRRIRDHIVERLVEQGLGAIRLRATPPILQRLREDGRGDYLDAALCALQAAWGWQRQDAFYGLPSDLDPVEGWIVTVPRR
jgi:hypothetical protein